MPCGANLINRPDAEAVADAARAFGQEDDITVLTIKRLPVSESFKVATVSFATSQL
jgi:hypothetical protein